MNLIELFENKPFQNVGTFNSIFPASPILGVSSELEVEIKEQTPMGRKILVGEETIFIDLQVYKQRKLRVRTPYIKKTVTTKKKTLPSIYLELTPTEFMIYSALKELGSVSSQGELSRLINVTRRSIGGNLERLIKLGLVEKKENSLLTLEIK